MKAIYQKNAGRLILGQGDEHEKKKVYIIQQYTVYVSDFI